MAKFFFVNKTASSTELTRSHKNEKTLLLSHVQSKRRFRASACRANPSQTSWTTSADVDIEDDIVQYKGRLAQKQNMVVSANAELSVQQIRLAAQYMPKHNCTDPFNSTVAADSLVELLTVAEMMRSTTANVYLAHASAPISKRHLRLWTRHMRDEKWLMEASMSNSMVVYAILLSGSYQLAWMNGQNIKRRHLEDYTGRCLEAVRLSLRNSNNVADQRVLRAVQSLALTSLWDGLPQLWNRSPSNIHQDGKEYLEICKTHLLAFVSLLDNIGGWSKVLSSIRDSIILTDRYRCIQTMSIPIIDDLWYPDPLFPEIKFGDRLVTDEILPHMAVVFADIDIHQELQVIIQDIVHFARVAECLWFSDMVSDKAEEWLFLRLAGFFHRLLSLNLVGGVDNTVRIALLLFLTNTNEYYGSQLASVTLLGHLKRSFQMVGNDQIQESLRFWVLSTASMTTLYSSTRDWFDLQLISMVEDMQHGGLSVREFRDRLLPTLYIPLKLDSHLNIMVDRLKTIRASKN